MRVYTLGTKGYFEALFGLGLSYGLTSNYYDDQRIPDEEYTALLQRLNGIATRLAFKPNAENKFLRFIQVHLDIDAPLYWWKQMDQYKVSTTTLSESTMHTITSRHLRPDDFSYNYVEPYRLIAIINEINEIIDEYKKEENKITKENLWYEIISLLPSCYNQRRYVSLNYANLQNIIQARRNHKLKEWNYFIDRILEQAQFPYFLDKSLNEIAINELDSQK